MGQAQRRSGSLISVHRLTNLPAHDGDGKRYRSAG
jgi:hypothetical protein